MESPEATDISSINKKLKSEEIVSSTKDLETAQLIILKKISM